MLANPLQHLLGQVGQGHSTSYSPCRQPTGNLRTLTVPYRAEMATATWDCRCWNQDAYTQEIMAERYDQFSTVQAVTFLNVPQDASLGKAAGQQLLMAAYSTGLIRVFRLKDAVAAWLTGNKLAQACLCWAAHNQVAATSLALLGTGSSMLLVSGGADGFVHAWRLTDVLAAMYPRKTQAVHSTPARQPSTRICGVTALQPYQSVKLPPAAGDSWGAEHQPPCAVTCMVADSQHGCVYLGTSTGRVHIVQFSSSSSGSPASLHTCGSHLAGVWCIDLAPESGLLATGSEDGSVRLWDIKAGQPSLIISPTQGTPGSRGTTFPPHTPPAAVMPTVKTSPPVTGLRFGSPAGGWLLIGCGGPQPSLTTWSLDAGMVAARMVLPCTPQVLAVQPGEILVAGTGRCLYRYSFDGQLTGKDELHPQLKSVVALDIMPPPAGGHSSTDAAAQQQMAPGAIVLGGPGGTLEVLSRYSTRLACTHLREDLEE